MVRVVSAGNTPTDTALAAYRDHFAAAGADQVIGEDTTTYLASHSATTCRGVRAGGPVRNLGSKHRQRGDWLRCLAPWLKGFWSAKIPTTRP